MKNVLAVLSILSVLTIAGCSALPNVFGSDVVTVQTKTVENGVRDVLTINDVQTIPRSPILPDQSVLLSFIVENRDSMQAARAYVDLFNAPTMKNGDTNDPNYGKYCNDYSGGNRICNPSDCGLAGCDILAREQKPISFSLRTPSENEIKSIKTDVKLNFKVGYKFAGSLNMLLPAVNMDEIIKRQRAGEKTDLAITKSYGSGPIQIDAEIQGAQYILSNVNTGSSISTSNPESVILFTVNDRGSGDLVSSEIKSGAMTIIFSPDLKVSPQTNNNQQDNSCSGGFAANDKFCCYVSQGGSYVTTGAGSAIPDSSTVCVNNRGTVETSRIPLYLKQSRSSLRFAVTTREQLREPFRTYQITSGVDYDYEIRGAADVSVNPFQNV